MENKRSTSESIMRYSTAKGYLETCKMIYLSPLYEDRVILCSPSMHLLIGFSIELFLKSWLLHSDVKSKSVRAAGHKLMTLYDLCRECAFPIVEGLPPLIRSIDEQHRTSAYRYLEPDGIYLHLSFKDAFITMDKLDYCVDDFIGASKSKGLEPGH